MCIINQGFLSEFMVEKKMKLKLLGYSIISCMEKQSNPVRLLVSIYTPSGVATVF